MENSTSSENDSLRLLQLQYSDGPQQGAVQDIQDAQDTQSVVAPIEETFNYPTSALPSEGDVQDTSNPETPAPDTNLTPHINNADAPTDAPTIPSFLTVTEKFADEFWTSAITSETVIASPSTAPHAENAESPTDPFEFIPSPGCSEDDGSKSTRDPIEYHEEPRTTHSDAEPEVGARIPDIDPVLSENGADEQIDKASPLVPSGAVLDSSSTTDALSTPESLSLAAQPTPSQEEVEEAWPAPSNDNMNSADAWGVGAIAVPDTNPDDGWGSNNEATAAGPWGIETKGGCPINGGQGGGGWKADTERGDDRGYDTGGFRRDRTFWQPPERDGGWEGFRKRVGFKGGRHDYQESGGGRNDNGPWKSSNNDRGYNTNTTDRAAIDPAYPTKNDTTWDTSQGKDVEAAWGLAPESRIEKPTPEEREGWALPQTGNAWDAAPPPSNGRNPYRPVGTHKGSDVLPAPRTVGGDASWGTGTVTKKVLDSKQTEGMIRRVLGERGRTDTPRPRTNGSQPPQVEEPPDEEEAGDEEGDITPPPTTPTSPTHTRRSAPYSYVSSRSRRAGSPTLTATTLDTGYTSAGTTTTTGRRLTKVAMSGVPPARHARSRAGTVVRKTGGRIVYEDGMDDEDEDEYEYIYQETHPSLARGREVVLRDSVPAKQRVVYQQAHPQYVYVYEGEEEYEDGELYYAPAPAPQHPYALARRPAQPKSMSFRVPNTNTDVTITVKESTPPPVRYALARPRPPAERMVYVPEPARRARTVGPRIYEVGDGEYTIAGDDEFDDVPVIAKPIPKGRTYIRE